MILIVEDEADVLAELIEMLELRRCAACGADSVASALERIGSSSHPLTLLTDLRLGDGSGLDLMRGIWSDSSLQLKVARSILMTGHTDLTEQVRRETARHNVPVLFKPVDLELMLPLLAQGTVV